MAAIVIVIIILILMIIYETTYEYVIYEWNICNIWKNFRWIPKPGVPSSKPLADSKVDSAFHPSEVDKWVPGIFGPLEVALALRQLNPIHKKGL